MVDTQVLSYGTEPLNGTEPQDLRQKIEASRAVLRASRKVYVSATAWMEFRRYPLSPHGEAQLPKLTKKLHVLAFTGAAADRAAILLRERNVPEQICRRCLNSKKAAGACPQCNRLVSPQQRLADAMIVATAELSPYVDTLYTYDGGVLEFERLVSGLLIVSPHLHHGPLWDRMKRPLQENAATDAS